MKNKMFPEIRAVVLGLMVISFCLLVVSASFADKGIDARTVKKTVTGDVSLKHEVQHAIGKGLTYLLKQQQAGGWWSQAEYPALTGLVLTAFAGDPSGYYRDVARDNIVKGYNYLIQCQKPDGGIYVAGLANYNTSVSLMALLVARNPAYKNVIEKAREFIISEQDTERNKNISGDNPYYGGIGYGGRYTHSDLSNTMMALEAVYYSNRMTPLSSEQAKKSDLDWKAALKFVQRCQNLPGYNDQPWASDDPANRGGFVYFPGNSKAGEMKLANGKIALRSYGSMSYAGLLSYIYADLDTNDPRVKAAVQWLSENFSLDENPGMGKQGLYYYYHTMAKALSAARIDELKLKDGKTVNWRDQLVGKLLDLQRPDGSWVNENGRWWEKDPVLVTSYSLLALEIMWRGL